MCGDQEKTQACLLAVMKERLTRDKQTVYDLVHLRYTRERPRENEEIPELKPSAYVPPSAKDKGKVGRAARYRVTRKSQLSKGKVCYAYFIHAFCTDKFLVV